MLCVKAVVQLTSSGLREMARALDNQTKDGKSDKEQINIAATEKSFKQCQIGGLIIFKR